MHGPGDVRVEDRPDPTIQQPTDAIVRLTATCVCGSDLWGYRGINDPTGPQPMGHEYCGVVEAVGEDVRDILKRPGGEALVRAAIAEAKPWQPEEPADVPNTPGAGLEPGVLGWSEGSRPVERWAAAVVEAVARITRFNAALIRN